MGASSTAEVALLIYFCLYDEDMCRWYISVEFWAFMFVLAVVIVIVVFNMMKPWIMTLYRDVFNANLQLHRYQHRPILNV